MKKLSLIILLVCFSFPVVAQDGSRESIRDYYQSLREEDRKKQERYDTGSSFDDRYDNPFDVPKTSKEDRYKKIPKGTSDDLSYKRAKKHKSSESILLDLLSSD